MVRSSGAIIAAMLLAAACSGSGGNGGPSDQVGPGPDTPQAPLTDDCGGTQDSVCFAPLPPPDGGAGGSDMSDREGPGPDTPQMPATDDCVGKPDSDCLAPLPLPDASDGSGGADAVGFDCGGSPADPESAIQGLVYLDGDQSSCTWYDQGVFPKYDSPMIGEEVRLYGADGEWSTTTCSDGGFQFPLLAPGNYLVDARVPGADDCTSSNQPQRLPEAVAEGEVTIVTVGDSIAVVGPGPLFPEILAGHLAPLADVQNHNIAVSGTHSTDWIPGTALFDKKLVPELPGADVLIITLGGNDIMAWVGGSLGNYSDLYTKMLELDEFLAGIHANIVAIVTQARKVNPNVDIVFCLYFNYAQSSYWQNYMGSYKELALAATANAWEKARKNVASLPGIVVADLYGALEGELIDPYLSDSVHLSAKGHQFYAEQIFMVLGGARVGADSLGLTRQYGFHLPAK